jgi:hypothetical protein
MTVYAVPCGVSVLSGLLAKKDHGPRDAKPGRLLRTAADLGRGVLNLPDDKVVGWWAVQSADAAAAARLTAWQPRVLSAETNTLAASSGLNRLRDLLERGDRIVLLGSDTDSGIAAALYVAQHIAGISLSGVAYLTTPELLDGEKMHAALSPGTLTVVRLSGLNPKQASTGFINAVASTGLVLRAAFDVGEALEVHLTGGFKATLLHTLAMTEVLYSLAPDRVKACYMFDDADADAAIVPIGMRRFDQITCEKMRYELTTVRDRKPPQGARTFEGLAWSEDALRAGSKDPLNSFGYGYLAVLGEGLTPGRPGPTG